MARVDGLGREAPVLAAVEEQWFAVVAFHAFHFADEDGVIPGQVFADDVACEFCERAPQHRNSGGGPTITNSEAGVGFGRLVAFGEMFRESLLAFTKDADTKAALRFEEGEKPGVVIHADENQKGIEGNRREGIGGHAVDHAGVAFYSNYGDARSK